MEEIIKEYIKTLNQSDSHLSSEQLVIYNNLKFQLSDREIEYVESHLNECSKCKSLYEQIVNEDIEIDPKQISDTNQFSLGKFVKYSIAASVLIAVGLSIYFMSDVNVDKQLVSEQLVEENPGIKKTIIDTVEAERLTVEQTDKIIEEELENNEELYAVNVVLENFIERNVRSKSKVSIIEPESGKKLSLPIKLEWQYSGNNNSGVELIIVNNKNETVLSKTVVENVFILETELGKGLYYWKIKIDGKVEAISKFSI